MTQPIYYKLLQNMGKVFAQLSPNERKVIFARFGFEGRKKTLEETAKELKVTRERIRQVEARGLEKFRLIYPVLDES